jgi:hypothetical protein
VLSTGTRLVLGFALFSAIVFAALQFYGGRSLAHREPDSPAFAARQAAQADNTLVGLLGGIVEFHVVDVQFQPTNADTAHVEARILGARDSGRLGADLSREDDRWRVRAATFTLSDGTTIPVAGSAGR